MKNKRLEERRKKISSDVDIFVEQSFDIVDRIHEILAKKGKDQKYLASALGKSESEISKWMTGTHNFTINTLAKIQAVLGEPLIQITKEKHPQVAFNILISNNKYSMCPSNKTTMISKEHGIANINKDYQHNKQSCCLN